VKDYLTRVTKARAAEIVARLSQKFAIPEPNVAYDCPESKETFGSYNGETNTICINSLNGTVPEFVPYHEFGHALQAFYVGPQSATYDEGEGFASRLQEYYLLTNGEFIDWTCSCGNDTFTLMPDGSVACDMCGTQWFPQLYSASEMIGQ
jgi:hypothetical protein